MSRYTRSSARLRTCLLSVVAAFGAACGGEGDPTNALGNLCLSIRGSGETVGDRNRLMGNGMFTIGNEQLPAEVGLYLFEMSPAANGGMDVETEYQFNWDNGDSFLSQDEVFFEPTLIADRYTFNVRMTIISGTGRFKGLAGQQPIALSAIIEFGPPANPGDPRSAREEFTVGGSVCVAP